jgi:outer membrane protein OmpA-like peptidoglycan-associated protein
MKDGKGPRRRAGRLLATATGALAVMAALLAGLGCAPLASPGWQWDRDSKVLPLKGDSQGQPAEEIATPIEEAQLRSVVILLPDADGSVGVIEVTNPSGTATLSRAREAVAFDDLDRTFIADQAQIQEADQLTLDAEPAAPQGFTVYFLSGSTGLAFESEAAWKAIVDALTRRNVPEVTVAAHADRAGSEQDNHELSERRALAIRDALVSAGLDGGLIEVAWYGETRPAAPTEDGVAEPRNRRAEIRVR